MTLLMVEVELSDSDKTNITKTADHRRYSRKMFLLVPKHELKHTNNKCIGKLHLVHIPQQLRHSHAKPTTATDHANR